MKTTFGLYTMAGLLAAFIGLSACNNAQSAKEDETEEHVETLKQELKDVGQSIDELASNESEEFKAEAQKVLYDFNQKLDQFEKDLKASGQSIDQKTRAAIDDLEQQADKLETKLEEFGDNTEENFEEFAEELEHDFSEFGESVKNFFSDNV